MEKLTIEELKSMGFEGNNDAMSRIFSDKSTIENYFSTDPDATEEINTLENPVLEIEIHFENNEASYATYEWGNVCPDKGVDDDDLQGVIDWLRAQ